MANLVKQLQAILRLRLDSENNYVEQAPNFIPASGEICLIKTNCHGLQYKVGDGATKLTDLPYELGLIHGFFNKDDSQFYETYTSTGYANKVIPNINNLYHNIATGSVYLYYDGGYICVAGKDYKLPDASETEAGILKLYSSTGSATDGTMTQKAISDKFKTKVGAKINELDVETLDIVVEI